MRVSRRGVVALLATALVSPALPSLAASPLPPVVVPAVRTADLELGATTTTRLTASEQLVGVTWQSGSPRVAVRWRTAEGWTPWDAPEDDSDAVDPAERAGTVPGTEPVWRPPGADLVQVRTGGTARGLRLVRVGDGETRSRGVSFGTRPAAAASATGLLGAVRSRADWGADESLRRGSPRYAARVHAVVVHHTAGSNDYGKADVPRRLRADYAYHVRARGWADLGYNLVVDKWGRIWEGRAGGLGRATVGTHSAGFNTGTLGVSVLGDMTRADPPPAVVRAVARVAAYAAGTWRFDPTGRVTLTSGGSPKYRKGTRVTLPRVHGHKDTGRTACPGRLYDRLARVRADASTLLGPAPRIREVVVRGAPVRAPVPLEVSAALTRSAPWSVAVRDSRGEVVAKVDGRGTRPELVWRGTYAPATAAGTLPALLPAPPGRYSWAVRVDNGLHAPHRRTGTFEVGLPVVPR